MKTRKRGLFFLFTVLFIPLFVAGTGLSNSVTLEDATKMALTNNEQVLSAQTSLEITKLNLERAQKLFATPHINLDLEPWQGAYDSGAGNFQSSAQVAVTGTMKLFQGTDISLNYQGAYDYGEGGYDGFYSLQLHQSLFQDQSLTAAGMELYNARIARDRALLVLGERQKEVVLSTIGSFYQLLGTSNSLDLAKERVILSQEKLAEVVEKRDSGLVGELDVLQTEIQLAENNQQLSELENQLKLAQDQFYQSIDAEKDTLLIFPTIWEEKLKKKVEEALSKEIGEEIISSSSELRQAQWTVDEKRLQVRKKQQDLGASWSMNLGYISERSVSGGIAPAQAEAKIGVTYNLFDGGRAKLSVQTAEINLEKAERDFENLKRTAQFSLSSERNALREALSQFNLWQLRKEEIKLRGELAQEQFTLGIISDQELKEFQLQEIQLENSYQSALDNLLTSYSFYKLSLGMNIDLSEVIGK